MARIESLFASRIYQAAITGRGTRILVAEIERACRAIARDDRAGQAWSKANGYRGYTSYASLDDLAWRDPSIAALVPHLDAHAARFARALDYDVGRRALVLDSLWINLLQPGGGHAAHIHPRSAISGTYYVVVPPGASAIRFEDPRLPMLMAAPSRRPEARRPNRTFAAFAPKAGSLLLWESFLRHEVPVNAARSQRISISFNYRAP